MIESLLATGCIKQGKFILKSGEISKYYFDMKGLISYPKLMKEVGDKIYNLLDRSIIYTYKNIFTISENLLLENQFNKRYY